MNTKLVLLVTFLSLSSIQTLFASPFEADKKSKSGTVACGGNFFDRMSGTEKHSTSYILRNLDDNITISINAIRVYNAQGVMIANYDIPGMPLTQNNTLGPGNGNLIPHMSAQFRVESLIAAPLGVNERPIQVHFDWTAQTKVLMPEIVHVRNSRRFDTVTNKVREERGRHLYFCRHIAK